MKYEFKYENNILLIKLSGSALVNECLLTRRSLLRHIQRSQGQVIIDLSDLREEGGLYALGILNMIRKEVHIMGGKLKLYGLKPNLQRQFKENRWTNIFDIFNSIDDAKRSLIG